MGKITDDKIKLTIEVNGSAARNELGRLEKEATTLSRSYKQLLLDKKKLDKSDKDYGKNLSALNKKLTEQKMALEQNRTAQEEFRKQLGYTGLTMNQLNKEAAKLRAMKSNLTPGTEAFKSAGVELDKVNARIRELKGHSQSSGSWIGKLGDSFNRYQALAMAAAAAIAGVVLALGSLIKRNADLSDSFADVRKTTGFTAEEMDKFNSRLKQIDTRSSRKELLELARIAGKLGIKASEDVFEFVRAADQINVALSADLGGNIEETVRQLGKLVELFGVKEKFGLEQALLKTGSAINALGASSTANEQYMVNFTRRLGGVGKQANISLPDIIGYGAALDVLGQTAEVSSTALSKTIVSMFKDPAEFAAIAQMSVGDFTRLLETDANAAFIKFLEGLRGNNEGLTVMAQKMDGLGVDGARAVGVLAALAENLDVLQKQQAISNSEFDKGTSLTQEFDIKNNNLAATLDKVNKRLASIWTSPGLNKGLQNIVNWFYELIKIPVDQHLYKEKTEVDRLVFSLTAANTKTEDRVKLLGELARISPLLVRDLKAEKIETAQLVTNLQAYNEELSKRIVLANLEEDEQKEAARRAKLLEKKANIQFNLMEILKENDAGIALNAELSLEQRYNLIREHLEKVKKLEESDGEDHSGYLGNNDASGMPLYGPSKTVTDLQSIQLLYKALLDYEERYKKSVEEGVDFSNRIQALKDIIGIKPAGASGDLSGGGADEDGGEDPGSISSGDGSVDKSLDKIKEYRAEVLRSSQSLIQQEKLAYEERLRQAGIFGKRQEEMTEEDLQIQQVLLEQHLVNIQKINDDAFSVEIKQMQDQFALQMSALESAYNEQLKAVGENEMEQAAIKAAFKKQEEEMTRRHLETLLSLLQGQLADAADLNLDLEDAILSDEAKADLLKKIEEVKLALSQLGLPVSGSSQTGEEPSADPALKVDIFGMSSEDWTTLLQNLADGKVELSDMLALSQSMTNAWEQVNQIRNNNDERALQEYEERLNERKELLNKQLKYEMISYDRYTAEMSSLDKELDDKKKEIARDQAKRQKTTAIFSAIINTATAVVSALSTQPPWLGIVLAALVGAMGAFQIATIASEPLPQFAKGKYDVIGQQDGKTYSAPVVDSPTTGLVQDPAILVGEKPEIIIDPATTRNLMVNYPHVIEAINAARVPQFASGDYSSLDQALSPGGNQQAIAAILAAQTASIEKLNRQLEQGIMAKLLADDEYIRTHKDVDSRYSRLTQKATATT